ncbi:MAG: hypothetical protein ACLSVD_03105 [Eggerthellaceae bacterium]
MLALNPIVAKRLETRRAQKEAPSSSPVPETSDVRTMQVDLLRSFAAAMPSPPVKPTC